MFPSARPNWLLIILTDLSLLSTLEIHFIIFFGSYQSPLSQHSFHCSLCSIKPDCHKASHQSARSEVFWDTVLYHGLSGIPADLNPHDISLLQRSSYFTIHAAHYIYNPYQ